MESGPYHRRFIERAGRGGGGARRLWRAGFRYRWLQSHGIKVAEQDPENRILFSPVTDDDGKLLGVLGMIADNEFFASAVLPAAIDAAGRLVNAGRKNST